MTAFAITLIRSYQSVNRALVSARFPLVSFSGCRSWPTCSDYAVHAVTRHGVLRGGYLALLRFLKCNPLFAAGQPMTH